MTHTDRQRDLSVELLRILAMALVCLWHVQGHYAALLPEGVPRPGLPLAYVCMFSNYHVDLFVLISGYFGIRSRRRSFTRTLSLAVFYAAALNIASLVTGGGISELQILLPLSHGPWWFIRAYLLLVLVSPVVERYVATATPGEFRALWGTAALVSVWLGFALHDEAYWRSGYDLYNFLLLYITGCALRRRGRLAAWLLGARWRPLALYALCCAARYKVQPITCVDWYDYSSPLTIAMAVAVFAAVKGVRVPGGWARAVTFLSSSAVAVYLITDYPPLRPVIAVPFVAAMRHSGGSEALMLAAALAFVAAQFAVCCCLDKARIWLSERAPARRLAARLSGARGKD